MRKLFVLAPVVFCLHLLGSAAASQPSPSVECATTLTGANEPAVDPLSVTGAEDTFKYTVPFWRIEVKPQPISIPEAEYPEKAREAGIEGSVVVEALIDTNGSVADTRILKTSGISLLDESAVKAARKAKFHPGSQRDKPVRVWVSLPFRFRLDDGKKTDPTVPKGLFVRDDEMWPRTTPGPYRNASLDSALAALARMLTDSTHGESLPRLAVTPFEKLNGSVGDTGVYMAEALEALLASSGRCRVVERDAVAQLLGVVAPTRAAVMDTAARRNLVRVFRLSGIVAGTLAHMDGGTKIMARVVNPRTGLITRTGEVWVRPEARPQNPPPGPPPRVPPTYPAPLPGVTRFEGEDMKILRVTAGTAGHQALGGPGWAESWSGGNHLWWRNAKLGDRLELGFDVQTSGTYRLKLRLTKANDYGIEQCYLDGRKLGEPTDLYNGLATEGNSHAVTVTGPLDMSSHVLKQGQHKLEFRIVGINPKAVQSYMFGLDFLDLERISNASAGLPPEMKPSEYPDTVLATVPVGYGPFVPSLTPNSRYLYVPNLLAGDVSVIRTSDKTEVTRFALRGRPSAATASRDGQYVYISCSSGSSVVKVRVSDNAAVDTILTPTDPWEMVLSPDGNHLYVGLFRSSSNRVVVAQLSDDSVVATPEVNTNPWGLALTPDGSHLYVACRGADAVAVLRTADYVVVDTIPVGHVLNGLAISADGQFVYVTAESSNVVHVIRTSDNSVVASVPVADLPTGVAVLPDGKYLYVASYDADYVSVIRTSDYAVVKRISVGSRPDRFAVMPDGSAVYVVLRDPGGVAVIGRR